MADGSDARRTSPALVGGAFALGAAALFGLSTPFLQRFGAGVGAYSTAGLLYVGAALASAVRSRGGPADAPLARQHLPRVIGVALCGALVAPVCLAWGLHRTSATLASLLLASESLFTVLFARIFYREPLGPRVVLAVVCIAGGAVLLVRDAGSFSASGTLGAVAVLAAALAWALDSVLSRPLADLDLGHVVLAKSALGVALGLLLAIVAGETVPPARAAVGLIVTGTLGYGVSLRAYLAAQRRIGVARTGSIFASAPFLGAAAAWVLGDRTAGWGTLAAGGTVAVGVYLHLTEQHHHRHRHVAMEHDHLHRHDDGHHRHAHDPPVLGEHSHAHRHEEEWHDHPHASDVHHQHSHE